jgi:hypothetical protein
MSRSNNARSEATHHAEAVLRQRMGTLMSPEALRVLGLRYEPAQGTLLVGCVEVPCWLQLAPEGSGSWAFGCPWWSTQIPEDRWFETRVLAEVGKARMCIDGMEQTRETSWVN